MHWYDVFELILILIWLTVLGLQLYLFGFEKGERVGRHLGCRCRREGGCPCERQEAQ